MARSPLSTGLRHRLIQQLAAKQRRSHSAISQGFTLIELLVVVIIVGILASVALPGFLSQAEKSKVSAAKSLVSAAVKECQVWLVEADTANPYAQTVAGTPEITLTPDAGAGTCTTAAGGSWEAEILSSGSTFAATLDPVTGIDKTCSSDIGCDGGKW